MCALAVVADRARRRAGAREGAGRAQAGRVADGHEIPAVVRRLPLPDGSFDRLRARIQQHGIAISAETNTPEWDGLPVDYDACVNAIGGWDPM